METRCFHLISQLGFIFGLGLGDICQSNAQVSGYEPLCTPMHSNIFTLTYCMSLEVPSSNFIPICKEGTYHFLGSGACSRCEIA